jgi:hypothetical protein
MPRLFPLCSHGVPGLFPVCGIENRRHGGLFPMFPSFEKNYAHTRKLAFVHTLASAGNTRTPGTHP